MRKVWATVAVTASLLMACGGDGSDDPAAGSDASAADPAGTASDGSTANGSAAPADGDELAVTAGDPFPQARCEANRAAGTITFLTGFGFAATASTVEMMVAEERGYFDDLCLDVEIKPSFSTSNYPLIAANEAQFASAGSFSEVVSFARANDADFVVTEVFGHVPIEALIVKPGTAATLEELDGTTIGVKGKLPPATAAMLASAGLHEGEAYRTVLLDGFDPTAHIAIGEIDAFPGYKSNEPGTLERENIEFDLFDPIDHDIAGSFGVVYTNREFIEQHPTAAADVVRAALRGMADAIADPRAAADIALARINGNGNPNFMSPEGERFRWRTDAELISTTTPAGVEIGVPDPDGLRREVEQNAELGLFGDAGDDAPAIEPYLDTSLAAGSYAADGTVIWPTAP